MKITYCRTGAGGRAVDTERAPIFIDLYRRAQRQHPTERYTDGALPTAIHGGNRPEEESRPRSDVPSPPQLGPARALLYDVILCDLALGRLSALCCAEHPAEGYGARKVSFQIDQVTGSTRDLRTAEAVGHQCETQTWFSDTVGLDEKRTH